MLLVRRGKFSSISSGPPDLREEIRVVVTMKHELFLILSATSREREPDRARGSFVVQTFQDHCACKALLMHRVLAGRQSLATDDEIKRNVHSEVGALRVDGHGRDHRD